MNYLNFKYIFQNAFDTFKVFETIPTEISGLIIDGHSKSIWQILNHLVIWRKYQIDKLSNIEMDFEFNESESWIINTNPIDENQWFEKIEEFHNQTEQLKVLFTNLKPSDSRLNEKIKLILESSNHLSFHLGEIILIARQKNSYPSPDEMNEFLLN